MPVFAYKGLNAGGKAVHGVQEAESPKALGALLKGKGVFLTECREEKTGGGGVWAGARGSAGAGAGAGAGGAGAYAGRGRGGAGAHTGAGARGGAGAGAGAGALGAAGGKPYRRSLSEILNQDFKLF